MTKEEIKNTPELVDFMLDECVLTDSRAKVRKRLEEICDIAVKVLEQEPCEDAISRQEVLSMQYRIDDSVTLSTRDVVNVDDIEDLPPVTPQPRTGHWVEENINEWSRKVFCSECGCAPPFEHISSGDVYSTSGYGVSNKTKYCPNCGARMVESQESEGRK